MDVTSLRDQLTGLYRGHIDRSLGRTIPVVTSADELIALVKAMPVPDFEAGNGWEGKPPFPGLAEVPTEMPRGWRMICAHRLFDRNGQELAVIYITFISGGRTTVIVNAPGTYVPEQYLPIAAR